MKTTEDKTEFIKLRAEGRSYSFICNKLKISKDTCHNWELELKAEINQHKTDQLRELYESYYMVREARIKRLGETLNKIGAALDTKDLTELPTEKLLDFKLKYQEALKGEYVDIANSGQIEGDYKAHDILNTLGDLLNRIRSGEVTTEQAAKESLVIANMLKAYETVELQGKIEALEAAIGARK